ncbi:MAG: ABC transporter substrate-binding protein [Actinomycetota bacterium]|nr:ABC transporter substrate-binding protein [Actinomycetota bacterium]
MSARRVAGMMVVAAAGLAVLPASAAGQAPQGTVRIPFPADDGNLTPYTFRLGYPLMSLIYDTLALRDAQGVPRPWLARSIRREGSRVTIRLRRGVRWQDGRPLTAADVVFTFEHVATRPHPRFTPQLRDVEDVRAVGTHTVVVTLRRPSLGFRDQPLADVPILPAHLWRNLPLSRLAPAGQPIGSGPYRLVQYRRNGGYRFEANRRYFRGAPSVRRIEVPIIRRAARTLDAFRSRRVDAIPVSLPDESGGGLQGLGVRVTTGTSYLGTVLMLNLRAPPLNRPAVRRAIAGAIDLNRIARTVGSPTGGDTFPAARGYLHPASRWATAETLHRFDPRRARRNLSDQTLPSLPISVSRDDPVRVEAGRQVALALRGVGVRARVQRLSQEGLERAVGQDGGTPTFRAAIWSAQPLASYDPSFLRAVFGSASTSRLNYSGYRSAAFDRLADRVASAPTIPSRKRAVASQLRLLARDAPVVPLVFTPGAFAFRDSVYDDWVFVKGSGILEKRSFVDRRTSASAPTAAVGDPIDPSAEDGSSLLPVLLGAGGLLGLIVASLLVAGARGRRR